MFAPWHAIVLLELLIFWVAPWVIGGLVGSRKGLVALGIVLGVLLGWIGVIIIAFVRPTQAELVRREHERMLARQQARAQFPPPQQWQPQNQWLPPQQTPPAGYCYRCGQPTAAHSPDLRCPPAAGTVTA
jgi:hypothetical protein